MRYRLFFCCGCWILGLALAGEVWGQPQQDLIRIHNPMGQDLRGDAFPSPIASAQGSPWLEPATLSSAAWIPRSPYQQWQQTCGPQPETKGVQKITYVPNPQGSGWIEELLESLPLDLKQGGIRLGHQSPLFLGPDGLLYRQSY